MSLAELNTTLARANLVLKARQTFSERLVACVTAPGKVEGKTLFWLTKTLPEGVVDEDEAAPAENPGPLALPEAGEGA